MYITKKNTWGYFRKCRDKLENILKKSANVAPNFRHLALNELACGQNREIGEGMKKIKNRKLTSKFKLC